MKKKIDWNLVPNFTMDEFPEDPDQFAEPGIIYSLQQARLKLGVPVYPSPVSGALARTSEDTKKSMHYADPASGILSRAVDFFVEGNPVQTFFVLLAGCFFSRLGIYFDTFYAGQPWVMFHGDLKRNQGSMIWYRLENKIYRYPDKIGYLELINYLYQYRKTKYQKNGTTITA